MAGNGIQALLFSELRPTPLVSFGCRFKKCEAAVMITASHNPPEYNGYKVYWSDGGQVVHPHDEGIMDEIKEIQNPSNVKSVKSLKDPLIVFVLEEIDFAYIQAIHALQNYPKENRNFGHVLKFVYTSLHGTGITMVPPVLKDWGFTKQSLVNEQVVPDGNFTTVKYPNPEDLSSLKMGIDKLEKENGDLLIATDPDADRLGVVVRHQGKTVVLTGNEVGCICLEHICKTLMEQKRLPLNAGFIKTIVTTELFKAIAQTYQRKSFDELIGFKYVAHRILEWEENPQGNQFIFAAEESLGYLLGTSVRDKDGVSAAALVCEVSLQAKLKGKTLVDLLHELYEKHGVYSEELYTIKYSESKEGHAHMKEGMDKLRQSFPEKLYNIPVVMIDDYLEGVRKNLNNGYVSTLTLPKSNILSFWLADGSKVTVRPSGTEPKIKLYGGAVIRNYTDMQEAISAAKNKVHSLIKALESYLKN